MIEQLIIISLATVGFYEVTQEGLLLFPLRRIYTLFMNRVSNSSYPIKITEHFFEALYKPLFDCPTCMASIWGSIGWFMLGGSVMLWPVAVLALAFLNTAFSRILDRL